jgi:anaerobic magnesium-protoporphyrin IX monomethyl ester cyclase
MADITLVNPVFPSNTTIPPYGLLYLAAVLEEKGYTVDVRDYQIYECPDSWEYSNFLEFLKGSSSIIGATTYSFNLPFLMKAFTELKKVDPEKTILLGGIGATGVHTALMNNFSCIDVVVRGEAEKTLPQLLTALEKGTPLDTVCGITYRNSKSNVVATPPQSRIKNLDDLPHPAFQKIDFSKYLVPNIMYSRGCPFDCLFCDIAPYWDRKNSRKSLSHFLEEIKILREEYNQKRIAIVDDTFVLNKKMVLEFCESLKRENLDIEWGCYGRVDLMDELMIDEMAKAGCKKIYYGIESGNNQILEKMKKGFTIEQALKTIDISLTYFDVVQTSFVWGFPFETVDQFHDTFFTIVHLAMKGVAVKAVLLTPFPLSQLYQQYKNTLTFSETLCPSLYLAGFHDKPEIIALIKEYKDVFPSFYYYNMGDVEEKYRLSKELGLSAEEIFDLWERSK